MKGENVEVRRLLDFVGAFKYRGKRCLDRRTWRSKGRMALMRYVRGMGLSGV